MILLFSIYTCPSYLLSHHFGPEALKKTQLEAVFQANCDFHLDFLSVRFNQSFEKKSLRVFVTQQSLVRFSQTEFASAMAYITIDGFGLRKSTASFILELCRIFLVKQCLLNQKNPASFFLNPYYFARRCVNDSFYQKGLKENVHFYAASVWKKESVQRTGLNGCRDLLGEGKEECI